MIMEHYIEDKRQTAKEVVGSVINKLNKREPITSLEVENLVSIIKCKNPIINNLLPAREKKIDSEVDTDLGWDQYSK